MERLSTKKRATIVRQYLSGMSYDEIAAKNGASKGTVANVVAELKTGKFTEVVDLAEHIESLRELSIDLNRLKMTPGQCAAGLVVLTRINECGLEPADINRWPLILKAAGSEAETQEFVRLVYNIQDVQQRTGLSLEDLDNKGHELERKAAQLEPLLTQYEDRRKQLAELTRQRKNLGNEVANLEQKYNLLNPRVKDLEKREEKLSHRIRDMEARAEQAEVAIATFSNEQKRLRNTGLSLEALIEFNEKAQSIARHHHIIPTDIRDRLLQELAELNEGLGLETLIWRRQKELEEHEQAIAEAKQESESLKTVIASLKQEKVNLEANIKAVKEKVSLEMVKIVPIARDTINQFAEELRRGHAEALTEVKHLKDEALEVGKEVGRFEGVLQANQWLSELITLVRGEEGVEGKRVRLITLLALRGTATWLKHNATDALKCSNLPLKVDNLIKELEQWKA